MVGPCHDAFRGFTERPVHTYEIDTNSIRTYFEFMGTIKKRTHIPFPGYLVYT